MAWVLNHLVPSCWWCLGRFKRCGLAGMYMSLGAGFENSKRQPLLVFSLCFLEAFEDVALSFLLLPPRLPFADRASHHGGLLYPGTVSPNQLFLPLVISGHAVLLQQKLIFRGSQWLCEQPKQLTWHKLSSRAFQISYTARLCGPPK